MKRFLFPIFLILMTTPLFSGGQKDESSKNIDISEQTDQTTQVVQEADPIEITDAYDRIVQLDTPALRVVSMGPNITETIYALGKGGTLVGRTEYCDYPAEALNVETAGTLQTPNIEKIVSLDPDLVIGSTHFPKEAVEALESLGISVAVCYGQETFEGVYDSVITPVAALLGAVEEGEVLIESMKVTVNRVNTKVALQTKRPRVYYVVGFGDSGDWTAGGGTFINEVLFLAGADNIASDSEGWSYSKEKLVEKDPEIILLPYWAVDSFPVTPVYEDLTASKTGEIYGIDENIITRQGPRLAQGLESLAEILVP